MGAGWHLWRLKWFIALQFWWMFVASMALVQRGSRSLQSDNYVLCNMSFVDLLMFPFDDFWGMCRENSYNAFLLLFAVLWVFFFAMLGSTAALMLWHAFICSLGLGMWAFSPFFLFAL
jgi:hypothetical protein